MLNGLMDNNYGYYLSGASSSNMIIMHNGFACDRESMLLGAKRWDAWFQFIVIPHMISVTCGPFITSVSPVEQILRIPNLGQGMHTIRCMVSAFSDTSRNFCHVWTLSILVSPVEPILRIPHGPGGKE